MKNATKFDRIRTMQQNALKQNCCWTAKITFYFETSGGKTLNIS